MNAEKLENIIAESGRYVSTSRNAIAKLDLIYQPLLKPTLVESHTDGEEEIALGE